MSTTAVNERLAALTAAGVSVWLDQIRRSLIEGGELQRMVTEESLRGVTSNPSLFEKAILESSDYDDDLRPLASEQLDARATYDRLAIREAYISALERRHAEGKLLGVNSAAHFFVSRVDANVEGKLAELGRPDLAEKAGPANAQSAYRRFQQLFSGPRWLALEQAGAAVQPPLWASSGVKNPQ